MLNDLGLDKLLLVVMQEDCRLASAT